MFEIPSMVPESFFEWYFRSSAFSFRLIVGFIRDIYLVHNIECKSFIAPGTFTSNSAIAFKIFFAGFQNLLVV